jgi:hypothetical protein
VVKIGREPDTGRICYILPPTKMLNLTPETRPPYFSTPAWLNASPSLLSGELEDLEEMPSGGPYLPC